MQCYTELTPPTAVTHSLSLPFVSSNAKNTVVVKTSLLQIFEHKTINRDSDGRRTHQSTAAVKLVLVAEYALSGTVTDLAAVNLQGSGDAIVDRGHAILLSFRDAKLSLIQWDPDRNSIETLSIHYFEQNHTTSPWAPDLSTCESYIAADPQSRCAALHFGQRNLAILPFKQADEDTTMDDWDEELDGPRQDTSSKTLTNGHGTTDDQPYAPSFVLTLSNLDSALIFPIHLAFLYEYREPTFGILSSRICPSSSLLHERRDLLSYMVFTIDHNQKASTTILAVHGLPYDVNKIVPLPTPIGGALVIGSNELIHIDQAGKTNGVAVNPFAKQSTAIGLADQSDLAIRLEGCLVEQLSIESGEMLVILQNGRLFILSFRLDGRSVSGVSLHPVDVAHGGTLPISEPSTVSRVNAQTVFLGSEVSDSIVVGWSRSQTQPRRRSHIAEDIGTTGGDDNTDDDDGGSVDEDDEDDDDLYGDAPIKAVVSGVETSHGAGDYVFKVHDNLLNLAPLRDLTLGQPTTSVQDKATPSSGSLCIVAASGKQSLVCINRDERPRVVDTFDIADTRGLWAVSVKKPASKDANTVSASRKVSSDSKLDNLMIVSKAPPSSSSNEVNEEETSDVYTLTSTGFEALSGTEFEPAAGATIEVGTLGRQMRLIQVLKSEVRSYDGDLGLAQIVPMFDEETGAEPKIVAASIADPYLLLIRDDASIFVAQCDSNNELEEIEREDDTLLTNKWLSGCLHNDSTGMFGAEGKAGAGVVMFLLNATGALFIYSLPDLSKPVYTAEGISFLPTTIAPQYVSRRSAVVRETLTEILVADVGDSTSKQPYLLLRSASDDLIIYQPYRKPSATNRLLSKDLHFNKVHNPYLAKNPEVAATKAEIEDASRANPMRHVTNLAGHSTVFIPGDSPSFLFKSAKSTPKQIGLKGPGVRGFSGFHTAGCVHGFAYVDNEGVIRICQLSSGSNYELGMPVQRMELGVEVTAVGYHSPSDTYAIACSTLEPFELPNDDDHHREWAKEDITFKPTVEQSTIHLISPKTWSIINSIPLEAGEVALSLKVLDLEVSEETHARKQLVTIGTAIPQGEDLPIKGAVYVYDVVTVVAWPDRPETDKRLKLVAKEYIPRGAVTAVSSIGTQGFMLIAQGQKCMVRGLKEDGTLLPVAFMDMNTYVTSMKELAGTGLVVVGDAIKGVWLVGYTEEPYKLMLFGKQTTDMEIVAVDFLPIGEQLFIVAADSDCALHALQFDPEHPKSLHGQRLLHRTTFSLGGTIPTTTTLLPATQSESPTTSLTESPNTVATQSLLLTLSTGSLALLTPLTEEKYRRLSALASMLTNTLYHPAGLNPKMFRIEQNAPESVVGGRSIVDGAVLERFWELGTVRRSEVAGRVGGGADAVREDLEALRNALNFL